MPVNYKEVYDQDYFNGKKSFFYRFGYGKLMSRYFGERYKHIVKYIDESNTGRVLDAGCAYGIMLKSFPDSFQKFGIDISEYAIDVARKKMPDADFRVGGIEDNLPYEENFFDVVIANDLLEHLKNPEAALKNIHSVLKKRGIFYITTPNLNVIRKKIFGYADKKEHHISLFPHGELMNLLGSLGFKIEDHWTFIGFSDYFRFDSGKGVESIFICRK